MFGLLFDGHPNLTRILMRTTGEGFPQRKDYPLGGIPVEYKGRGDSPARPAEVIPVTASEQPAAAEFTVTGADWDALTADAAARNASSSTWDHSTHQNAWGAAARART